MNITVGFIAIFISVVIPGLLFLRFYYFGEFSKQFTTKEPIARSLLYSIIPGVLIQILGLTLYRVQVNSELEMSHVFAVHHNLLSQDNFTNITTGFLDDGLAEFCIYSLCIFILAIVLGYLLSRVIRLIGLDLRIKLFRFKNQWYYILRGELLGFKKFKQAVNVLNRPDLNNKNIDMVFADVLINSAGKTKLYTGFVVDYDLDSTDISKLDKIYLFDAHRYKQVKEEDPENSEKEITITKKIAIPGSVFILDVSNLVNINLLYVTSPRKNDIPKINKWKLLLVIVVAISTLFVLGMVFYIFKEATWINFSWYKSYMENAHWYDKLLVASIYIQTILLLLPKKNEKDEFRFFYNLQGRFIVLLVMIALFTALNHAWIF